MPKADEVEKRKRDEVGSLNKDKMYKSATPMKMSIDKKPGQKILNNLFGDLLRFPPLRGR